MGEFVVQDMGGQHSAALEETRARLIQGASWKKQRVVVILPSDEMIAARVALTHWNLLFPPNQGVIRILALGQEVGEAYSRAIEQVLADPQLRDWEYVLTLEHDNTPPQDGLLRLIERMDTHPELAAIGGLYFTKGPGGVAQIWGDPKDPVVNFRPQVPVADGSLVECCGTGMGFTLFRLALFKDPKLPRPLFQTLRGTEGKGVGTQDLMFWAEARKHGHRCAIDCGVRVGHYSKEDGVIW